MNIQELRKWVGVADDFQIRQDVIDGMKDVPVPTDDASQMEAFRAFLVIANDLEIRPGK